MAIVVPILLSYTGAAAAIGTAIGISATAVSAIASVAFQVTGINSKINKAASKVFGEDLVMIANVAGAVYGAVNGGFGGGGSEAGSVATAGEALSKAALDGTTAFGANSVADAFDLAGAAGGVSDGLGLAGEALGKASLDGTNAFGANSVADGFNLSEMAQAAPDVAKGVNLLDGSQDLGIDTKASANAPATNSAQTGAAAPNAAAQTAAAPTTAPAAPDASSANAASLRAAAKTAAQSAVDTAAKSAVSTKPASFFDKLLSNDKAMGAVVQGVGGALSSAAQSKTQKEALDFAKRKYHSTSGVRVS